MSGTEHLKETNESSVCIESYGERGSGYANSAISKKNGDRDVENVVREGLGMVENRVQGCDSDGMGSGISPGVGLSPTNDDRMTRESLGDVTGTSICGNEETLEKSLSPIGVVGGQASMGDTDNCSGPVKLSDREGILGEKAIPGKSDPTCVAIEDGNQVSSISQIRVVVDSLKSELSSELNVEKTNSFIPEVFRQSLIAEEDAGGLDCELNSQNKTANLGAGPTNITQTGLCDQRLSYNPTIEDQEDVFGHLCAFNQEAEERIDTQFKNDSTAEEYTMECSSENIYGSGCVDDILKKSLGTSNMALENNSAEKLENNSNIEETHEALQKCIQRSHNSEQSEQKTKTVSEAAPDNTEVEKTTESNIGINESYPKNTKLCIPVMSDNSRGKEKTKPSGSDVKGYSEECEGSLSREPHVLVFGCPAAGTSGFSNLGRRKSYGTPTEKRYPKRSAVNSSRESCARSEPIPDVPEPSSNLESGKSSTGKRRGRKKKTEIEGKSYDEFLRMRKHLRYLLHRIRYEQNLLDAYSSEGWRGLSLEKLRPEKELERAKADINRSKLKIRDLLRHLDTLSAEGRFPESLFDSEGLIDSEDIFCAKCGTKDLITDNDIILCDGACERGFHQFCLEPPLLTEEIPPGDEGWLCPACDCKVDCVDLLNDSQLTKLSIEDSWEKVFPEAIVSSTTNEQDDIMGLPSDDSGDNDYNPDGLDDDEAKVEGSGSRSDASDSSPSDSNDSNFSYASEDLGALGGDEQYLGLPSDDSEDDDYNPTAANVEEDAEKESSSSDFTSASENLGDDTYDDGTSGDDEHETPVPFVEPDQSSPPFGRRHVERLDYKKLYDEAYANGPSDSSDDEEWKDTVSASKKKGKSENAVLDSSKGNASTIAPPRRGRKKLDPEAVNGSPTQPLRSSEKTQSSDKSTKRPHNRLGEAVTQRLYELFKENQYPDRLMKEKLANELGLTPQRVDKWFGNARWSFNHHPKRTETDSAPPEVASNAVENTSENAHTSILQHKKRKNTEASKGSARIDSSQTPEAKRGNTRKKRKSTT